MPRQEISPGTHLSFVLIVQTMAMRRDQVEGRFIAGSVVATALEKMDPRCLPPEDLFGSACAYLQWLYDGGACPAWFVYWPRFAPPFDTEAPP